MTDAELSALEAVAKAATPGPWRHPGRALVVSRMSEDEPLVCDCISQEFAQAPKNAAFIATANPSVVLELIAEMRQARAERDWLAKLAACNIPTINDFVRATQGWLEAAKEATCIGKCDTPK